MIGAFTEWLERDGNVFVIFAWVAGGGDNYSGAEVFFYAKLRAVEGMTGATEHDIGEVRVEKRQERLDFGVAEANVVFEHLWAVLREH